MKRYLLASTYALAFLATPIWAQDGKGRAALADEFPVGGWKTSDTVAEALIATGLPATIPTFLYSITNPVLVDSINLSYTIQRDGQPVAPLSSEGNSVAIEGRNLSIRQNGNGVVMQGVWSAFRFPGPALDSRMLQWGAFPGRETIVASFDKSRLLVVSLFETTDCTNETMQLKIDDQLIKFSNGGVARWLGNGSVLTYGKKVSVTIEGTCSPGIPANGRLRYSEPM